MEKDCQTAIIGKKCFPTYKYNPVNLKFIRIDTKKAIRLLDIRTTYKLIDFLYAINNQIENMMEK